MQSAQTVIKLEFDTGVYRVLGSSFLLVEIGVLSGLAWANQPVSAKKDQIVFIN